MAFGFKREKGSKRGYINEQTGQRISRRQYDKIVSAHGAHKAMPETRAFKQSGPLQRQYNALLQTYVNVHRERGEHITKAEARKRDDFKRAVKMIRTKRRVGESRMQREARQEAVNLGFEIIGGRKEFSNVYDNLTAERMEIDEQAS